MLWLWCARLTWVLLPVSAGGALNDALDGWSNTPARVATLFVWAAWMVGLIALLAPRPWGLTALRIVAPAAVLLTLASVASTSAGPAVLAVSTAIVAAAFALSSPVSQASTNAMAYGDEVRYPLRIPLSLLVSLVPLAVLLVGFGIASGPLLLADGRIVAGVVLSTLGFPIAYVMIRSLHSLAQRFLVLVPAGIVIVDPLTLADPVLMRREHIVRLRRGESDNAVDSLDLRLGTRPGTVELELHEPQPFPHRKGRHGIETQDADVILVSTVRNAALVVDADDRHITTG